MELQYTPYTIPLVAALALAIAGTGITWVQREDEAELWSVGLQLSVLLWVLFNLLMISTSSLEWVLLWYTLFFPCLGLVIVTMFGFTLHFTGRGEQLTRRRVGLLASFPAGTLAVSLTNSIHGQLLVDPTMVSRGSYAVLDVGFGPAAYPIFLVGYGLIAVYVSLLALQVVRSRNIYRKLSFVFLVMVVVMTAATTPKILGVSPFPYWIFFAMAYLVVGIGTIVATTSVTVAQRLPIDRAVAALGPRSGNVVPLARNVILQEADNGIFVLDTNGRVVDINRTAKTILGIERPVGKLFSEITQEELTSGGDELRSVIWGEAPLQELRDQIWAESPRGERCYDVRITELTGRSDTPAGFVVLLHDITGQKRSEQQLKTQRNELQTQKQQLEHQNEQLDQFASIVSHDLRNPLNVAQGNVELPLSRAGEGNETVEIELGRLETIRSAHERMEDIIDDALTLAREGKAITETEMVALGEVVEAAWENVETDDATLEVVGDGDLDADRDRLLTVFENLVRNAIEHGSMSPHSHTRQDSFDHGRSGDEALTLRVGLLDNDGFYIADDGVGIPAEERNEIFEHGHTTSDDGTGLGLSIVRDIVRGHGWEIEAAESPDGGARFEITGASIQPRETDSPE